MKPFKPSGVVLSLSSEVHCDKRRIRCKMGYLFALMLLLVSISIWMNLIFTTSARFVMKDGYELLASDPKLADVAAELALKGFERNKARRNEVRHSGKKRRAGTVSEKRRTARDAQRKFQKLRNRKDAPKITPPSESLSSTSSFAACMLIKDDNEILSEWIAYHYFVLKLRQIVIAVDPLSTESPTSILSKWRDNTDMEIIEWYDRDYMPIEFLKNGYPPAQYLQKQDDFKYEMSAEALLEVSNHRYRQRVFLGQCMKEHRKLGNSWVIHIDTDEYIIASKLLRQIAPDDLQIPSLEEPSSMFNLLRQVVAKSPEMLSYPCISLLRLLFGSVESDSERVNRLVPPGFNATQFETLRWRHHGKWYHTWLVLGAHRALLFSAVSRNTVFFL